jgi:thioredoxin
MVGHHPPSVVVCEEHGEPANHGAVTSGNDFHTFMGDDEMKRIYPTLSMLFMGAVILLAGCRAGGEMPLTSAFEAGEESRVPAAPPVESAFADAGADATRSATTLAAAPTVSTPPAPALITLAAGDDLREYLDGSHRRVILDFYADWCGPCRRQGRVLHDVESAASSAGALIVKINVDQHKELARSHSVQSLPTLMVWEEGRLLERHTGLASADQLLSWIRSQTPKAETHLTEVNFKTGPKF